MHEAMSASAPRPLPIPITPAIARHFTQDELQAAGKFLAEHDWEIPKAQSGPIVFPDALQTQIARQLKLIAEGRRLNVTSDGDVELNLDAEFDPALSDEDYESLIESAPESLHRSQQMQEVMARIAVASGHQPRRNRSVDRYMATTDEYIEPYFAVRDGMSLGEAARKFNIVDIQAHMTAVEMWLSTLE